jgi:hypothetical protein
MAGNNFFPPDDVRSVYNYFAFCELINVKSDQRAFRRGESNLTFPTFFVTAKVVIIWTCCCLECDREVKRSKVMEHASTANVVDEFYFNLNAKLIA